MVTSLVNFSPHPRQAARSFGFLPNLRAPRACASSSSPSPRHTRHRDAIPVSANPLESALTNCDARKSFRIRSYEKCRVSPAIPASFSSASRRPPLHGPPPPLSFHTLMNCPICKPFVFRFMHVMGGCTPPSPNGERFGDVWDVAR